jgi:voltage-gated potassium channel Kch
MSDAHREAAPARLVLGVRLVFLVLVVFGLVLGYIGLRTYTGYLTAHRGFPRAGRGDLFYYDVELFLVQSTPLSYGGPIPSQLQVARFYAPCVALLFTFLELIFASAGRIRRARISRSRGHIVVCGSTRAAEVLADRLRAGGARVVTVGPEPRGRDTRDAVVGDPCSVRTLLLAGTARAERVYACLEHGPANAQVAEAVERIRGDAGRPHRIHALIEDAQLCTALQARRWSAATPEQTRIDFFNLDELAARAVVRGDTADLTDEPPQIAIVGTGAFAQAVLVESARQWLSRRGARPDRMRVSLIGPHAPEVAAHLSARFGMLQDACRIEPDTEPYDRLLARRRLQGEPPLRRLYLCQQDETEALKAALSCANHLSSALGGVVVRLDDMAAMARAFRRHRPGGALLDALGGFLLVVDVTEEGCDPSWIEDDWVETMARACHQRYLTEQLGAGRPAGSTVALVPWERLPENLRAANRQQVADIGRKLATIGCLLTVRTGDEPPFAYRDDELDVLAELEHERWNAERLSAGWQVAPVYDPDDRLHPALVAWPKLPEHEREKDRQAVLAIPALLADAGLAVVRIRPRPPAGIPA